MAPSNGDTPVRITMEAEGSSVVDAFDKLKLKLRETEAASSRVARKTRQGSNEAKRGLQEVGAETDKLTGKLKTFASNMGIGTLGVAAMAAMAMRFIKQVGAEEKKLGEDALKQETDLARILEKTGELKDGPFIKDFLRRVPGVASESTRYGVYGAVRDVLPTEREAPQSDVLKMVESVLKYVGSVRNEGDTFSAGGNVAESYRSLGLRNLTDEQVGGLTSMEVKYSQDAGGASLGQLSRALNQAGALGEGEDPLKLLALVASAQREAGILGQGPDVITQVLKNRDRIPDLGGGSFYGYMDAVLGGVPLGMDELKLAAGDQAPGVLAMRKNYPTIKANARGYEDAYEQGDLYAQQNLADFQAFTPNTMEQARGQRAIEKGRQGVQEIRRMGVNAMVNRVQEVGERFGLPAFVGDSAGGALNAGIIALPFSWMENSIAKQTGNPYFGQKGVITRISHMMIRAEDGMEVQEVSE